MEMGIIVSGDGNVKSPWMKPIGGSDETAQRKVVFDNGRQKVVKNDCSKELELIEAGSVDVIVTSPPYNIGIEYNTYEDRKSPTEYLTWMGDITAKLHRVLTDDGSFFLNVGGTNRQPYIPLEVCGVVADQGFLLQNDIIWVKSVSVRQPELPSRTMERWLKKLGIKPKELTVDLTILDQDANNWRTFGHFKPINSQRYLNNCWESIFHFTKTGNVKLNRLAVGVPYDDKSNVTRWQHTKDEDGGRRDCRCRGNVWHIPYKTVQTSKEHPAGFPIELAENCIRLHGICNDMMVLDPFLGAGTTLTACKNLGVFGTGIDVDEYYCQLSKERLEAGGNECDCPLVPFLEPFSRNDLDKNERG